MNVVQREKHSNVKAPSKLRNELVRKDASVGIRGASLLPIVPYNISNINRSTNSGPRYQFNKNEPSTSRGNKTCTMGPPLGPPRSAKRKIIHNSNSTKPESSSSGPRPKILASDSAAVDTSFDYCTPRNRPTALRYISSSSRGGHSGTRSGRSTSTSALEASVILAISEGRGMARGEIGMAAVDLRQPHLVLCQFSDTLLYVHTLTKINYFNPVEIIVPHTFCEGVQPNQLYQLIRDHYPLVNLTTVQRRHFNDAAGRQQIQTLCAPQYSGVYLQVLHKFYAVTAAAAVLKYVEYIQCIVFARESLKIEYHSSEDTMVIDVGTATQLELVQPLVPSAGSTCCLLGVLGPTYTVGGIRALRAAILQPSCNKEFIEGRLDALQDLIENDEGLMTSLQDVVKKLADVDKILFLCMDSQNQNMDKVGEAQLNQTLLLKTTMEMVPKLIEALNVAESGRLRKIKMDFENPHYNEIAERIKTIIQDDAHLERGAMGSLQRCFAVKPDINGLLDVARRTYSELIDDIQKIVEQLSETYDIPIRLNQNVMKGFHIVMSIAPKNRRSFNVEDLPPVFIQVHNSGASVSMTTEELVVLDQQAKESLNEIQKMSNIVISSLLKELRPFMSSLYKLCENVAELDILLAMAQASSVGSYIRPEFGTYLEIRNSVHPLLDYNSQVMPVPNDIFASPEQNFTIITGPNMGGKSIYIKQIAVMQIMAQLGCFVPATNAVLRLCDRIFSRIGFNDSVELNASTYVFEMKEMQHIMTGLTKSSLVIIDELCRGTCTEEGTSIAWAICEELLISDAFVFFTTHFMYLTRLQDLYFNVVNLHTAVTEEEIPETQNLQKRLVYQHKIDAGATEIEHYGLALAEKTNLPEDTVKLARELAELIVQNRKPQEMNTVEINDEHVLYKLNAEIRQESRKHDNAEDVIKAKLRKFKEEHPLLIERLKVQRSRINIRTDSSVNYSSIANSRQSGISNVAIVCREGLCEEKNTGNVETTVRSSNVICSPSDPNNGTSSSNEIRSMTKLRQPFQPPFKNCNKTPNHKPTVIYSTTSDDAENYETSHSNNNIFTSVKSSNELLTTLMNNYNEEVEQNELVEKTIDSSDNKELPREVVEEALCSVNISDCNNNIHINVDIDNVNSKDEITYTAESVNGKRNENFDLSDDSDIADALTQVIEEYSVEEQSMDLEKSEDDISIDEELMVETINEIHKEINSEELSVENIILTPPVEFQD
ncbi:mutS protein homolog 4-like isoform X2 [Pectinophora gossypiella]|uniref:mutS protein homolog 4-like isoform X2 n=1 Tax=Pectinophora gossypiella TaxID=13191 RepID=UPI00214EE4E4|nr:mutS protein homolog 4-like isoform X2 [Pectinophora gossypiella]